eukprot:COSAG06_NODE_15593_length_1059_cov_1.981250_2_plen_53_part_00
MPEATGQTRQQLVAARSAQGLPDLEGLGVAVQAELRVLPLHARWEYKVDALA